MDAATMAKELVDIANAVTAFAAVQNLALSYALAKREFKYKFYIWRTTIGLLLWNAIFYALPVWWCSTTALKLAPATAAVADVAEWLRAARCGTILVFGSLTIALVLSYNRKSVWSSDG